MTRTLFIGLDGSTFTVLGPMTTDLPGIGVTMPFLKKFMEEGSIAKLKSTPNPLTPPAWVSIMTGKNPGAHGVYDFVRFEDKGGEVYFTIYDARDVQTEMIWSIASRYDKTILSLNFPITAPPRPINGALLPGFVSWKHLRKNTVPSTLYERLKSMPNFDPKELAWDFEHERQVIAEMTDEQLEQWVLYHIRRDEQWFRIAEKLIKEDNPDLVAVMFDGTDKLQHRVWNFLDPALIPANPTEWEARMRSYCLQYFSTLDTYIERLVTMVGPEAQIFMASDHGFTCTAEVVRINTYLGHKGYLTWRDSDGSEAAKRREDSWFSFLDWDKTFAYCPTPSSNGIKIRVAQKPGDPGVPPEEYETFREKLIKDLEEMVDPDNGERLITSIMKREDIYSGVALSEAPDLTMTVRNFGFLSIRNAEPLVVPIDAPVGTHHPYGIFLAGGAGIAPGTEVGPFCVEDVAATLLYSAGVPVPSDMEGKVAEGFFKVEELADKPITFGPASSLEERAAQEGDQMSADDRAKLMDQLKMLGYME